jgi:hypothetical protein
MMMPPNAVMINSSNSSSSTPTPARPTPGDHPTPTLLPKSRRRRPRGNRPRRCPHPHQCPIPPIQERCRAACRSIRTLDWVVFHLIQPCTSIRHIIWAERHKGLMVRNKDRDREGSGRSKGVTRGGERVGGRCSPYLGMNYDECTRVVFWFPPTFFVSLSTHFILILSGTHIFYTFVPIPSPSYSVRYSMSALSSRS